MVAMRVAKMVAKMVTKMVARLFAKFVAKMVARLVASASAEKITKLRVRSTRALSELSAHSRLSQSLFPLPRNFSLLPCSGGLGSLSPWLLGRSLLVWESL